MLGAVVAAWSTFALYPNPENQPAFERAVDMLATFEGTSLVLEVGAGAFSFAGEELKSMRDGADRLATRLYVHDVASLRMASAPSGSDLASFFVLLTSDEREVKLEGGLAAAMSDVGIETLNVRERGLLGQQNDSDDDGEGGTILDGSDLGAARSPLAAKIEDGASPEEIAEELLGETGGDPDLVAKHFAETFSEFYAVDDNAISSPRLEQIGEMLLPYLEESTQVAPIVTFVETFFHLPEEAKLKVFELFLDRLDDGVHRLFVDQFAGSELIAVADQLDEEQAGALLKYARETLDDQEAALEDLLPPLRSGSEVRERRKAAADRIATMLSETADDPERRHEQGAEIAADLDGPSHPELGWEVLRGLFGCEYRPHRFGRLLRICTGRIGAAVRERDFVAALHGIRAIQDEPTYPPEERKQVEDALGRLVTSDLTDMLWDSSEAQNPDDVVLLLSALGPGAVDMLVEELASEENAGRRKVLVELLGSMAESNLRHLVRRLDDSRWYVVRNLATVLGKSGKPSAFKPLADLMHHEDYRVRVEVLRAIVPIQGDTSPILIAALQDNSDRVRRTALNYLRAGKASPDDLLNAISTGSLDPDIAVSLVKIVARQATPAARQALENMASRKFAMKGSDRAVRQAAKEALRK